MPQRPGYVELFSDVTTVTQSNVISLSSQRAAQLRGRDETSVQVDISGTSATVDIQVRLSPSLDWVTVESGITASGVFRIGVALDIRLDVTAITAATVNGGVMF